MPQNKVEAEYDKLKETSHDLKDKIEELRKKTAMPVNSALGSTRIDAENADGRRDLKGDDDD